MAANGRVAGEEFIGPGAPGWGCCSMVSCVSEWAWSPRLGVVLVQHGQGVQGPDGEKLCRDEALVGEGVGLELLQVVRT